MSSDLEVVQGVGAALVRTPEAEALIREQFGLQDATTAEIEYLFAVAARTGLDPVQKQLYGIMRYDSKAKRAKLTVQVGIDGLRSVAARTKEYGGSDDAVFSGGAPKTADWKATVTVYRIVQGVRCPFTASARWSEYSQSHGQWGSKPHVMLAKCAESLALRKAFPAELGGIYTDAEMPSGKGVQDAPALSDEQYAELLRLMLLAGVSEAGAKVRLGNMTAGQYDHAVEATKQRIHEQSTEVQDAVDAEVVND